MVGWPGIRDVAYVLTQIKNGIRYKRHDEQTLIALLKLIQDPEDLDVHAIRLRHLNAAVDGVTRVNVQTFLPTSKTQARISYWTMPKRMPYSATSKTSCPANRANLRGHQVC